VADCMASRTKTRNESGNRAVSAMFSTE